MHLPPRQHGCTCPRAHLRLWSRPECPVSMRRRARDRLEVQGIARTCLELPSARSLPRITFRRRHTPSPPHGDQPFRNLIKAASPLDALRDSSLDAAARPRRIFPLSALKRVQQPSLQMVLLHRHGQGNSDGPHHEGFTVRGCHSSLSARPIPALAERLR